MALKAGSILDIANSMALAMEEAFLEEWPLAMGNQEKPVMNNQMRLMFVAMAKGVVRHIAAHPEAFTVTVAAANLDIIGQHAHSASVSIEGS